MVIHVAHGDAPAQVFLKMVNVLCFLCLFLPKCMFSCFEYVSLKLSRQKQWLTAMLHTAMLL